VPSLYGNRLALLFGRDTTRARRQPGPRGRTTVFAVHPFAEDRERFYRFRGGDTIQTLTVDERTIPIVRVEVGPRDDLADNTVVFTGEVDVDASRHHIVRMRGFFARVSRVKPRFDLLADARLVGIAYVELVNAEVEGAYWLPLWQRFEAQALAPAFGEGRAVFRIVSRFRDYRITPPDAALLALTARQADSLRAQRHRISVASADSLRAFSAWRVDIGAITADVSADDFDDIAPDVLRPTGAPRTTLAGERLTDLLRTNRVEGVAVGATFTTRWRDAAPGLTTRVGATYGVADAAVRGRADADWQRGDTRWRLRVGRSLDLTNDFRNPLDSGSTLGVVFGNDPYDHVDRRFASLSLTRRLPRMRSVLRVQTGIAQDRGVAMGWSRGLLGDDFEPVRGVDPGDWVATEAVLEWRPDVTGEFLKTGLGGRVAYLRGDGDLRFDRWEARLGGRVNRGRFTLAGRADGGVLWSAAPPAQQLFEIGGLAGSLSGYDYKEFAGDRAALARGVAMWRLERWTTPLQLTSRLWLPAPNPALSVGLAAGWTEASGDAARAAIRRLGARPPDRTDSLALLAPVHLSRPSDGWRTSFTAGVRFFGGALGVLAAKPLEQRGGWRGVVEFGQAF
jgi:hypothetical protein